MIGIASPAFCQVPFQKMLEELSVHFGLWEILSEGEDRLELAREGITYGRDSLDMNYQVHVPISDVNVGSVYEPMRVAAMNELKQTILMCHQMEIPLVTLHPGFVQGIAFLNRARALVKTKESVRELASFAKDHSIVLAIENMPANINATCTTALELLEVAEDADIGLCFDMGHANTAGQTDELLKLVGKFKNVHLHNNDGQWDQHNEVDDGTADLRKIIDALKPSYKGNLVIEATNLEPGISSKRKIEAILRNVPAP